MLNDTNKLNDILTGKIPITREQLNILISKNLDIRFINTSLIRDMSCLFNGFPLFNQDISQWDISNVMDLSFMFKESRKFNQDISQWDLSSIKYLDFMFASSIDFNKDLSNWKIPQRAQSNGLFFDAFSFCPLLDLKGKTIKNLRDIKYAGSTLKNLSIDKFKLKNAFNLKPSRVYQINMDLFCLNYKDNKRVILFELADLADSESLILYQFFNDDIYIKDQDNIFYLFHNSDFLELKNRYCLKEIIF